MTYYIHVHAMDGQFLLFFIIVLILKCIFAERSEVMENIQSCMFQCFNLSIAPTKSVRCAYQMTKEKTFHVRAMHECNFKNPFIPAKSDFMSFCAFTELSMQLSSARSFAESKLCTHIVLSPFIEHSSKGLPKERADSTKVLDALATFKEANIPVLAQVGTELSMSKLAQPLQLSQMASRNSTRFKFVRMTLEIVEARGFEGVLVYWFFPGCPNYMCVGSIEDMKNFVLLCEEFQRQFSPKGLLVGTVMPQYPEFIARGIDIEPISEAVDLLFLTSSEFHRLSKTGLVSSLPDVSDYLEQFVSKVENPRKLLAAVRSMYFNYLNVKPENYHVLNSPASSGALYGVCNWIRHENYSVVRDHNAQNYAYKKGNWFSFDDEIHVQKKVEMWQEMGLGGVWVYNLEWDDPKNECGCGIFPNTKSFMVGLRGENYCILPKCL